MILKNLLNSLGDYTNDAIVVTRAETSGRDGPEIVWVNNAFTRMTGYTFEEAVGRTPRLLQGDDVDPEARERIRTALKSWRPVRERLKNYRKDGTPFWVELDIRPVADDAGWYHYWLAVQRDVTQDVAQTQALLRALDDAKAGERSQSILLSTMSHEIRTPLNGILGVVQILDMLGPLNAEQAEAVTSMRDAGNTLLKLLNDILDLAQARAGKTRVQPADIAPRDIVEGALATIHPTARQKGLDLQTSFEAGADAPFRTDDRLLLQILANLLGNAVKFTREGGIRLGVRRPAPGEVAFEITDTGPGIPPDQLDRIFEPFRQAETGTARPHDGAGLGLAICRDFARLLGGSLTVESERGAGTTFRLRIPVDDVDRIDLAAPEPAAVPGRAKRRVLIIEDDELGRRITEQAFRYAGWTAVSTAQGKDAADLVRRHRPDVVILDRHLPDRPGDAIIAELRDRDAGLSDTPIIVLTADASAESRNDVLAAGASHFFSKPVDIAALIATATVLAAPPA